MQFKAVQITGKNAAEAKTYQLRKLHVGDAKMLAKYFDSLSPQSKQWFSPHPLTLEHAEKLCERVGDTAVRLVLVSPEDAVVGYFILDFTMGEGEQKRYLEAGIDLSQGRHLSLANSIADELQNTGLASSAMKALIVQLRENDIDSLVLMGGTRADNELAKGFYEKFGFETVASFGEMSEYLDMRLKLN